jgi:hypothetical protein
VYVDEIKIEYEDDKELQLFDVYFDGELVCASGQAEVDEKKLEVSVPCKPYALMPRIVKFNKNTTRENNYSFNVFRAQKQKYDFVIIPRNEIKLTDIKNFKVKINNLHTDKKVKKVNGVFVDDTEFTNFYDISKSPQEFVFGHSQFYLSGTGEIILPPGVYSFSQNIVIPRNTKLIIQPGANINLINDASFVSYSPVEAIGTETAKIVISGESDGVGENFAVLDNDGLSQFVHTNFSGGGESTVNGAFLSGMLAIHHANSIIKYSNFSDAQGDDSLNIKYASSTIAYNHFENNSADAIDYDFSDGVIEHNLFVNNGNDSIDTSGSPVLVRYNNIINSGDKCMSIGEKSTPVIFNNILNGCHIGIEVKDLSTTYIINNVIINNKIGINEYQKKEIFGGGNGHVFNTIIWNNDEQIVLDKISTIEVKNSAVESGYPGEKNITVKPEFNKDFTIDTENANIQYRTGGDTEVLREFLGLSLSDVPVGLIKEFESGL